MSHRGCVFVLGTRAQLVKVAPVLRSAVEHNLEHVVWFTGQHRESVDDLLADFELTSRFEMPAAHRERSSIPSLLTWVPGTVLACRRFLKAQARAWGLPPLTIVHGDTLSTLLGAAAARSLGAPVVHLESGLSSGSLYDPFPEEMMRRLTFWLTRYALCPNAEALARMRRFRGCEAFDIGENTLLDSVRFAVARFGDEARQEQAPYFVASIHRFQNIYNAARLRDIVEQLSATSVHAKVWFVLHPATERRLRETGLDYLLDEAANVERVPRMPYTRFLALIAGARGVFSDGGSNQEELSYLGVPTVLFRERSERPDGLGANIVLEAQLGQSLEAFVAGGGLDRLRGPGLVDSAARPSDMSAQLMAGWLDEG